MYGAATANPHQEDARSVTSSRGCRKTRLRQRRTYNRHRFLRMAQPSNYYLSRTILIGQNCMPPRFVMIPLSGERIHNVAGVWRWSNTPHWPIWTRLLDALIFWLGRLD